SIKYSSKRGITAPHSQCCKELIKESSRHLLKNFPGTNPSSESPCTETATPSPPLSFEAVLRHSTDVLVRFGAFLLRKTDLIRILGWCRIARVHAVKMHERARRKNS